LEDAHALPDELRLEQRLATPPIQSMWTMPWRSRNAVRVSRIASSLISSRIEAGDSFGFPSRKTKQWRHERLQRLVTFTIAAE
jgi:hypothetical protein